MDKKKLEQERAELQVQHGQATTDVIAEILKRRIAYLDWKIEFASVV